VKKVKPKPFLEVTLLGAKLPLRIAHGSDLRGKNYASVSRDDLCKTSCKWCRALEVRCQSRSGKPVARKLKMKWSPPKEIKFNWVALLPPPTALEKCPRCEKPHKKLKPVKFAKPMEFIDSTGKFFARASHWTLCPKTKEPVIFFDRADAGESILNLVTQTAVQDIQQAEDKRFLDSISALVGKKGSKKPKKPKQAPKTETVITAKAPLSDMQTWSWSLEDPPGVKKSPKPTAPEPGRKTAPKGKKGKKR